MTSMVTLIDVPLWNGSKPAIRLSNMVYRVNQHTGMSIHLTCQAYPLDGVVKAQVRVVLDLIDILWVKDNHGMRRPDDLKNASSLG